MKASFVIIGALALAGGFVADNEEAEGFATFLYWFAGAMFACAVMVMD